MGKLSMRKYNSEESHERIKKRKRKKDLEELRRNAFATKRNMHGRAADHQKAKTSFLKTLNEFAAKRAKIESVVQSQDTLIKKTKIISDKILPKPLNTKGFFLGGIKGKLLTRPTDSQKKIKDAILKGDALKLLQSGGYQSSILEDDSKKTAKNNLVEAQIKMNIPNLFDESSENSSCTDDSKPVKQVVKSSPILGGMKRKVKLFKLDGDSRAKSFSFNKIQSPLIKPFAKEEKCKRRLFEDESTNVNNSNFENSTNNNFNSIAPIRFSPRKSTPENVIFFTDRIPHKDVDNRINNKKNNKINPLNPKLIKTYVQICKMIAEKDLKNIFRHNVKDPMEITKAALKNTYIHTFKEYINQQNNSACKQISHSTDRMTDSNSSEIMLEPDSAIARILKKNSEFKINKDTTWIGENNSDASINLDDSGTDFSTSLFTIENNSKRKYVWSTKGEQSEAEVPSSVKVNIDPESVRMESKMNSIHPERQELIARYLNDVDTNNKHENEISIFNHQRNSVEQFNNQHLEQKKIYVYDNIKNSFLIHKNTKHIPAILRKSRSFADCINKEKILFNVEKYQKIGDPANKPSLLDFNSDSSLKSERTPNCGNSVPNQLIEAPKCKYIYMNAKYNQPSRINIPLMHNKRFHRNVAPERHLFPSPNNVEKQFVLNQNFKLSPLKEQLHFPGVKQDFHKCRLSQEKSEQNNNCMTRMSSFGDIQERANRLTLCSSQSQNCSQESLDPIYSSQEDRRNLQPIFYYREIDSIKNCMNYNNRPCMAFNKIPSTQYFDIPLQSKPNAHSHNIIKCNEKLPVCISTNDLEIVKSKDYIFPQEQQNGSCCSSNDGQMCRNHTNQQCNQGSLMNSTSMQQQSLCQPVKFIAIEENRMPQRRPVYNTNDTNACPFIHKPSISNQQFNQIMKSCYTNDMLKKDHCIMTSMQAVPQSIISSDFKFDDIQHNNNNVTVSNMQKFSNANNEFPRLNRNSMHFAPSNVSNRALLTQPNIPIHSAASNKKYVGQLVQTQFPSSIYSQDGYQANHYNKAKNYNINDDYQQQMNHYIHSKRP